MCRATCGEERRQMILKTLSHTKQPVTAGGLAEKLGVSRQIVVGDVALLRAGGAKITATPRGYIWEEEKTGFVRQVACRHSPADMERELTIMVDNGCEVLDVMIEHPLYGQLTGQLRLKSRYEVQMFLLRSAKARPLSLLTEGIHLHTLACPGEDAYQQTLKDLAQAGILWEDTANQETHIMEEGHRQP